MVPLVALTFILSLSTDPPGVHLELKGDRVRVTVGGELFTEYHASGFSKPLLYPVVAPGGRVVTRHWPMKEVEGEARDHRHHRSLWFAHGNVNGHDFWSEGKGSGRVEHAGFLDRESMSRGVIKAGNRWISSGGDVVCTDTRAITFSVAGELRIIDYDITLHASHGPVRFGDTKEGTMAIRLAPTLRVKGPVARGKAVNSSGVRGKGVWGKRASWVDYSGPVGEAVVGVAIFDHPKNHAHPTWWHARDYGLFAANPFGVHDFERKPRGTGDLLLPKGGSLRLRYRFVIHPGDAATAEVARLWGEYRRASGKKGNRP